MFADLSRHVTLTAVREEYMSNIVIRNVLGTGVFAIPQNQDQLEASKVAWESILATITGLTYNDAYSMVQNIPNTNEELMLYCGDFRFDNSVRPTPVPGTGSVEQLRSLVASALNSHPNIITYNEVDIQMFFQGTFYEKAPRLDHINQMTGEIAFDPEHIPSGAQIEVYKYTGYKPYPYHTGSGGETYPPRIGQRYRPDRLLAVGQNTWTVPSSLLLYNIRNQFRFAYRWPNPPGESGPGIRGPLAPFNVSTACRDEQTYGKKLNLFPSPSA